MFQVWCKVAACDQKTKKESGGRQTRENRETDKNKKNGKKK
jgi:hypothetical protein